MSGDKLTVVATLLDKIKMAWRQNTTNEEEQKIALI